MDIQFITSMAVITPDPEASRALYVAALGLPLQAAEGDDYLHSEDIDGARHFGVWPLQQAAQACFGTDQWPPDRPVPQASVEFEVADRVAVDRAGAELAERGFTLLHLARTEPWARRSPGCSLRRASSSASPTPRRCTRASSFLPAADRGWSSCPVPAPLDWPTVGR